MSSMKLMKGNEVFAEAAISAGCRYYFGYPITPQNELAEYMSRKLPGHGGSFVQAESELAAVSMAYGGAAAGGRVLISSSSPGIALMQEGISFLCSVEMPLVVINVSRGGPGVGCIQPGQGDYFQATRGGGNGDYHLIVYAPGSLQEAADMVAEAFDIADEYWNPVMILADGMLGQMMEPVSIPAYKNHAGKESFRAKPWALTGHGYGRPHNVIRSLELIPEELERRCDGYWSKYRKAEEELPEYETLDLKGAEAVIFAYGSTARIAKEAMKILEKEGIRTGMIRPLTLWPFPYGALDRIDADSVRVLVSAELSRGQMMQDVLIGSAGRWPVRLVNRVGGMLLSPPEMADMIRKHIKEASS